MSEHFYLKNKKEFACLNCSLPICNEESEQCLYTITRTRSAYWSNYYQQHKAKKLAAASARQKANRPARAEYMREYRARV